MSNERDIQRSRRTHRSRRAALALAVTCVNLGGAWFGAAPAMAESATAAHAATPASNIAPASTNPSTNPSATAAAPALVADVVPGAAAVSAANQLMRLQEDTVVLKAQLKKLDAQAQVAEREAAIGRLDRNGASAVYTLLTTESLGGASSATLQTADGAEFDVLAGDTLPDGQRVLAIRPGAVDIGAGHGGRRSTLTVMTTHRAATRLAAAANGWSGAASNLPTLPAMPPLPASMR
ncbi:type IV pilus biogenesis protein PilP [Paraburkholderia sp. Ac-20340]|uniref:type IV pilus biogenesis protein PilP n=1 Tax=Paraburkholderia sp. Ac-20340 TaxID=2703888 RepID=UPI001980176E|nr:type IV pilus biogenesis protein PilP [Paraburkholderia sp. Ac-20340]MBN3853202.1 type IV pilus biogenesis protein PilP [Paraburkholderia sp. Ac-20340]